MAEEVAQAKKLLSDAESNIKNGKADQALDSLRKALVIARQTGDQSVEASVLYASASAHKLRNADQDAMQAMGEALLLFKAAGDKDGEITTTEALATAAGENQQAQEASVAEAKAEELLKKSSGVADPEVGQLLALEAATLFRKAGKKDRELEALTSVVAFHEKLGSPEKAASAHAQMARIHGDMGSKAKQAGALQSLHAVHMKRGAFNEAHAAAKEARSLYKGLGDTASEQKSLQMASDAFSKLKDSDGVVVAATAPETLARLAESVPPACVGQNRRLVMKPPANAQALVTHSHIKTKMVVSHAQQNVLAGNVIIVTGASRGIGKGIAEELARAGGIVYVTGRSTMGNATDQLLGGTVDETAMGLNKLGGTGIAVHADHSQKAQNKALASLIQQQHRKCDLLVNNAFFIPKPDQLFFAQPVWVEPTRFLNEQLAVGSYNHAAITLMMLPYLRRGKGCVVNVSSWGSQCNIPVFPVHYLANKGSFDQTQMALAAHLVQYRISIIVLWPGRVRNERTVMGAKKSGDKLADYETARFSGRAVVALASMPPTTMLRYARRTIASTDCFSRGFAHDVDGFLQPDQLQTGIVSR